MELTTVQQVSRFVGSLKAEDIPGAALDQAAWCVLDLLGAAMAGFGQDSALSARRFARNFFPAGSIGVWFSREFSSIWGAAFCNSVAASALDLDDGHRAAGGHPGAALVPTALAVAQSLNSSGRDMLAALVIGYEVALRAAAARNPATKDTFSTGRWCGFGAATIRCWLEGRKPEVLSHALAISGIHAPLQSASAYSRYGHHTKEGIPWGTFTGLTAVDLASSAFVGPLDIWDHPDYYLRHAITDGLGDDWKIHETYFKSYACCRWLHAALDAWQALVKKGLSPSEVNQLVVFTFNRATNLNNNPDPTTIEQAQFSMPFCLAVLAMKGPQALLPMSVDLLGRGELIAFARKVKLVQDPEFESEFPTRAGARLVVCTEKRDFSEEVRHPYGDPANPFSADELTSKFYKLAGVLEKDGDAEAVVKAVMDLKHVGVQKLFTAMRAFEVE